MSKDDKKLFSASEIREMQKEAEILNNKIVNLQHQKQKLSQNPIPDNFIPQIQTEQSDENVRELVSNINTLLLAKQQLNSTAIYSDDDVDKIDEIDEEILKLIKDLEKITGKKWQIEGISDIDDDLKDVDKKSKTINNGITEIIGKVGKWAVAIFGVSSAYGAIQKAMSTLSRYDSQLASNIEYIEFALANTLKPVIQLILNLVVKLLAYMNYLSTLLFNYPLFAESGAKAFDDARKNAKGLKKELQTTKFDEMNTLQDNSNSGMVSPSFDLSKMDDVKIPKWLEGLGKILKPIVDFFDKIIKKYGKVAGGIIIVVGALAGFVILKKIIKWLTGLSGITKGVGADFTGFLDGLGKAASSIAILGGIALVIKEMTGLITSFSESGLTLKDTAGLLATALGTLAISFTMIAAATKLISLEGIAGAAVILGGMSLVLNQISNLITALSKSGMKANDVFDLMGGIFLVIVGLMSSIVLLGPAMTAGLGPFLVVVAGISAILLVMAATLPTILTAVSTFVEKVAPRVEKILETIGQLIKNIIIALGTTLPPIINSIGNLFTKVFSGISSVVNTVGNVIIRIMKETDRLVNSVLSALISFIRQLGPAIETFVDSAIRSVTKLINFIISSVEYLINLVVTGANGIIKAINKIGDKVGLHIGEAKGVSLPRFRPKLARGAVVNNPGKGVDMGSYTAGEGGREAILPLTDPSTMEMIGQAIGSRAVINFTNITKLDNRQIAREQRRINAQSDFAFNR